MRSVRYVRFPPKWRLVLVPDSPRSATALGVTLYTAVKPGPLAAQRVLWAAALLAGGRALPGRREDWQPPLPAQVFAAVQEQVRVVIGRPADGWAVYERMQPERSVGLTALACAGPDSVLVRVRPSADELDTERAISAAATDGTFRVPRVVGSGAVGGWHWIGYQAIATRPHAPLRRVPGELYTEITTLVESALDRPAGVPAHWRGCHGDVTPWNLRRSSTGTWLIDWEDAGWAPPGSDQVYLAAVTATLRPGPIRPLHLAADQREAADRWAGIVRSRPTGTDDRLRGRLLALLER